MAGKKQFSTFVVDSLLFGVEVEKVQEVIRFQKMTRVPLAPPVVKGLINLRGQIVTAIDLRRLLNLNERAEGDRPMNVVVRTSDGGVSLLVDEIGDVMELDDTTFERPPETVRAKAKEMIGGVHKLKDHLMHVLDTEKVINF
jgi:purine-binding chemotaxis protein CheW